MLNHVKSLRITIKSNEIPKLSDALPIATQHKGDFPAIFGPNHHPPSVGLGRAGLPNEAAHEAQTPGQQRPWRGAEGVQFAQDVPQEKGRQHLGKTLEIAPSCPIFWWLGWDFCGDFWDLMNVKMSSSLANNVIKSVIRVLFLGMGISSES